MTKKPTIVVKIGSALLANQELLTPRYGFLQRLLEDIAQLRAQGSNVILCSSGSVALGLRIIGETPESAGVSDKQAAAACGMPLLLNAYKQVGHEFGFDIAQVLLTLGDFEDHRRFLNTRNTVHRLLEAGVMPIIFASSLLMIPMFLFQQLAGYGTFFSKAANAFGGGRGFIYNISYVGLIYFFCYFWTAITFNPKDMASNLKDYGSFVPGYRPGERTAAFLEQVMVRITYVGAAFLALVAIIPTIVATAMGIPFLIASFYGGTGLLIVVSVALDLVQKIDSHLVMRNYPGLLEGES